MEISDTTNAEIWNEGFKEGEKTVIDYLQESKIIEDIKKLKNEYKIWKNEKK